MISEEELAQIGALAVLEGPVRRALYRFVVGQPGAVSREQAARALNLSHTQAGFHLDRLADKELLDVSFRRLNDRSGPGAGRPSKLYRRSQRQLAVTLPARRYELAARTMASAIERLDPVSAQQALREAARRQGRETARQWRSPEAFENCGTDHASRLQAVLDAQGYETSRDGRCLRLCNCPFSGLTEQHRETTCAMNLALVEGLLEELSMEELQAFLDPGPDRCCVAVRLADGSDRTRGDQVTAS